MAQPCAAKIPPAVSEAEDFRTRSDRFVGSSTLLFRPVGRPTFLCLPKENVGKRKGTLAFAPLLRSGFLRCSTRRPPLTLAAAPLSPPATDNPGPPTHPELGKSSCRG